MTEAIEAALFRQVMGLYPTGVVVVTAIDAIGSPIGMAVGSFTSVSLDPCMIAFLPDRQSSSWRALRESGTAFGVNVLASDQEWICRQVAVRKQDKFEGVSWRKSSLGNPLIEGCVAFLDCETSAVHPAGDHDIVVGEVLHISAQRKANSLLFYQGGYGSFRPRTLAAGGGVALEEQLRYIDVARPIMDDLASRTHREVTALAVVEGELVTVASAGRHYAGEATTRVGHRMPIVPPMGALHAAWGDDTFRTYWLDQLPPDAPSSRRSYYEDLIDDIKVRGYSVIVGHAAGTAIESASDPFPPGEGGGSEEELRRVIDASHEAFNPSGLDPDGFYEFHAASVPVFHPNGDVAFTLGLWGPEGEISHASMRELIDALVQAGRVASQDLSRAHSLSGSSQDLTD